MNGSDDDPRTRQARDSTGEQLQPDAARNFSELARELEADTDEQAVMSRIVESAAREIDGATSAALTLLQHGKLSSPAHTDDNARAIGLLEADIDQGPCVDTSRQEITLRVDDLRTSTRWPQWSAAAVDHGVLSAMSFQLFVEEHSMGALNVYSARAHAFDVAAENTGLLLASHAAVALASIRKVDNLHTALGTRDIIGQAKGILMERLKIDDFQAFDLLVTTSHRSHRKLVDVATHLTRTGEIPPSDDGAGTGSDPR